MDIILINFFGLKLVNFKYILIDENNILIKYQFEKTIK